MMSDNPSDTEVAIAGNSESNLVVRSPVTPGLPYREYKEILRDDFLWSCAYCTVSEFEAQTIRMTIDHYEPQSARPDLKDDYRNLMYCCDDCNSLREKNSHQNLREQMGTGSFVPMTIIAMSILKETQMLRKSILEV